MKGNEYNDLWVILENLPDEARNAVPEKYRAFVKASMIEGGESAVDKETPLEEQVISSELRGLLACLTLTYWAKDTEDRHDFAEVMHKNDLIFEGKPETPMTEEEYQGLLEVFDEWNEMFGPIPFWAESRGWQPRACYEIAPEDEADIMVGNTGLKEVFLSKEQRDQILEEAKDWILVAETLNEETLYWHDNDYSKWTSTKEIEDFYKGSVVIKDGHFFGVLIDTELTSSMGLSVHKDKEFGLLLTDGTKDGRTYEHYDHSSDEISESSDTEYYLKKA